VPVGKDESENVVLARRAARSYDFTLPHWDLAPRWTSSTSSAA
jgi:hypothetical protein